MSKPTSVVIDEKEYLIACGEDERELLNEAAELLHTKMQEVRASGKVIGSERIAVLSGLNIAHELITYKKAKRRYTSDVDLTVSRLQSKVGTMLAKLKDKGTAA